MSGKSAPIRFGVGGWRGVLGEEFTFPRARRAVRAIAAWLGETGAAAPVLVAHDTRFLADRFARVAVGLLVEAGIEALPVRGAMPTPVVARAVRRRRAAGALVFTASHNPPEYLGLKLFGAEGGALASADLRRIESLARRAPDGPSSADEPLTRPIECRASYVRALTACMDGGAIGRARLRVVYDAMHGSGAGVLDAALAGAGARVEPLRHERDPLFGGGLPDPTPGRLRELVRRVRAARAPCVGFATDGDADRLCAVDGDGRFLSETDALALLVDQLARRGRVRRGVGISVATGSLVEKVAAAHGLSVERFPMGFRNLSRALVSGRIDLAGDDSGGFAWAPFAVDKDGMLAACLLAEVCAETREPLRGRLRALERAHGPSACGRSAVPATPVALRALERGIADPPGRVAGMAVRETETGSGLMLRFDDGFLLLRRSGTEPVLRIHAEAPGRRLLVRRLEQGRAFLEGS